MSCWFGFEIQNIGIKIAAREIVRQVEGHKIYIVGLSALLTINILEIFKVIGSLPQEVLRDSAKIMVSGMQDSS